MKNKWIMGIAYLYLVIPVIIFLIGWVKVWISIPMCLALCYSFKEALSTDSNLYLPKWNRINIVKAILLCLIIVLWVYFSGIGNFVWQNADHSARNAFYEILVSNEWPVTKKLFINDENQIRGIIYYIGYWLPAAVIGKIFGITAGYLFQYLWAVLGILIGVIFLNSFLKKWSIWPLVLFIMFSGLDAIGYVLNNRLDLVLTFDHIEWWTNYKSGLQFSSFTTQLYWVYNQAVYAWIILALIMLQRNNRRVLWIWCLGVLQCTFPIVGMTPFVVWVILKNSGVDLQKGVHWKNAIKELITIENVSGVIMGMIISLYLIGNISVQKSVSTSPQQSYINGTEDTTYIIIRYVLFILLEIGIYYIYIYRYYKKNPIFYISLISLLLCPFVEIGAGGDFCMRASIPSLVILYYMVANSLKEDMLRKKYLFGIFMLLILSIGGITAVHEIGRSVSKTIQQYQEHNEVVNLINSEEEMFQISNFSGKIEDNLFFQYLAK